MTSLLLALLTLNDAAIAEGGTPQMLSGHPSVRMESEVIRITVAPYKTTADCRFVFANDGPACTVKMGFPDNGYGAADPEEESDPGELKTPPKTGAMTSFTSWVNGKAAKTKLERGTESGHYWHTKTVTFKAHAKTTVRDLYTLPDSSAIVSFGENGTANAHYAGYVVSTGASWKGTIGKSTVVFEMPSRVNAVVPVTSITKPEDRRHYTVEKVSKGTVAYAGMAKPTVAGKTLTFVRTNWRPTKADDIELWHSFQMAGGE